MVPIACLVLCMTVILAPTSAQPTAAEKPPETPVIPHETPAPQAVGSPASGSAPSLAPSLPGAEAADLAPKGPPALPTGAQTQPFPAWMQQDLPTSVLEYLAQRPGLLAALALGKTLARPLTFLGLFLFIGSIFGGMVRKIAEPKPASQAAAQQVAPRAQRIAALWVLFAWAIALGVACEAIGLNWFVQLVTAVVRGACTLAAWLAVSGMIAYAISSEGRELVLSLLGWGYLKWHRNRPQPTQEFDLGGGLRGRIASVELLHTTFDVGGGRRETRPNAWLMRGYFRWGQPGPTQPGARTP